MITSSRSQHANTRASTHVDSRDHTYAHTDKDTHQPSSSGRHGRTWVCPRASESYNPTFLMMSVMQIAPPHAVCNHELIWDTDSQIPTWLSLRLPTRRTLLRSHSTNSPTSAFWIELAVVASLSLGPGHGAVGYQVDVHIILTDSPSLTQIRRKETAWARSTRSKPRRVPYIRAELA
jgi:hypothetical protein